MSTNPTIVEDAKDTHAGRYSYALITPARNEAQFIELTIRSVVAQSVRPVKWVIVSDGSTDGTDEIVSKYVAEHAWIELLRKPERKERHFAAKVEAFNAGYARLQDCEYQVIGNLDADISFEAVDYFEFLIRKFAENPKLGVAGTAYREGEILYPRGFTSIEDVFGACQMFRRECFETIGGYRPVRTGGIDLIAFLSARAEGWQTRTFTEKVCLHHRKVGSAQHAGVCKRLLQGGRKDYLHGSHPAFEIFRSIYQMKNTPYVIGGMLVLAGYFGAMLRSLDRTIPKELIELRRIDQMNRLTGILKRAFRVDAAFGRAGSAESR